MQGHLAVGGEGQRRDQPVEIQLAIAGAGAVAIPPQVIQAVAVQLAAHQGLGRWMGGAAMLQQFSHRRCGAGCPLLQRTAEVALLLHQSR